MKAPGESTPRPPNEPPAHPVRAHRRMCRAVRHGRSVGATNHANVGANCGGSA
ncbi:hypothetical protein K402DRAFT_395334 [Aulographum hederae CBS 113979]|uniref:Uncharacterized protein n=1 Tax=Aulographum hederae CBS 113979 TaxID=1176131 RepID=A0A6G1GVX9_9PEZI|nr:hypothetical protein K402DRAFT_395334 [Aulographum hederae CBS 113979]